MKSFREACVAAVVSACCLAVSCAHTPTATPAAAAPAAQAPVAQAPAAAPVAEAQPARVVTTEINRPPSTVATPVDLDIAAVRLVNQGRLDEALAMAEQLRAEKPEAASRLIVMVRCKLGQTARARAEYKVLRRILGNPAEEQGLLRLTKQVCLGAGVTL